LFFGFGHDHQVLQGRNGTWGYEKEKEGAENENNQQQQQNQHVDVQKTVSELFGFGQLQHQSAHAGK
jgi:hypothetical protein